MWQIGKRGKGTETGDDLAEMQGAEKSDDATLSSIPAHFAQKGGQAQEVPYLLV